jgi:hypothetical protein
MLKSVRYCHAANAAMPDKFIQIGKALWSGMG